MKSEIGRRDVAPVRALPLLDVISGWRHGIDLLAQLNLEIDQAAMTEGRLATGQVELPHSAETLIVDFDDALAVGHEALPPRLQGFRVMQPQYLDVT